MNKRPAHKTIQPDKELLRSKLKLRNIESRKRLFEKHPHFETFLLSQSLDLSKLREQSSKLLTAGTVGSLLLTSAASSQTGLNLAKIEEVLKKQDDYAPFNPRTLLRQNLAEILEAERGHSPSRQQEKKVETLVEKYTGVKARAVLEGERLNTSYGKIGLEQHLPRYPGDKIAQHDEFPKAGITPGLGAWGYFARSKKELTPDLWEKEKYYAVVQTLYLPDWAKRARYLRDWYKYRKVLIVNTQNGNSVVAAIADAGPAAWTGKVFGGSPEVMYHLGGPGYTKGPVILLFVDDPENKVPLGPVEYEKISLPEGAIIRI